MKDSSLLKKAVTCIVAGLTIAALLLVIGHSGAISFLPPVMIFSLVGLTMLVAVVFPFVWQYKQNNEHWDSLKTYTVLYNIIRYAVAINLMTFAFKKFLGLQLSAPAYTSDLPLNQQTGEMLTWYYFSYSHGFSLILACLQVGGSGMLLFRRTLLLGVIVLFPLMLNITLVNIFYHLNLGALVQSIIVTSGIIFILLLHYKELLVFFIQQQHYAFSATRLSNRTKNLLRIGMVVLAFIYTYCLKFA